MKPFHEKANTRIQHVDKLSIAG